MSVFAGPEIVNDGLVLHLDAANTRSYPGSGTSWTDLSGNANNGTLVNGVGFSSSNNGAVVFDGVNDYVQVVNNNGFGEVSLTPTISLEMWANVTRKSGVGAQYQQLAGFRNDANFDFFFLLLDSAGASVSTEARIRTTAGAFDINVAYLLNFDKWTHIVYTANVNRTDLYLDGVLAGSNTGVNGSFGESSGNFRIGQSPTGAWSTKGDISSVKVYNKALTATEVRQNYNATKSRYNL